VFVGRKKAIFVNGCFWHAHDCRIGLRKPKTNKDYWLPKIARTKLRDKRNVAELLTLGWDVLTLWECGIRNHAETLHGVLKNFAAANKAAIKFPLEASQSEFIDVAYADAPATIQS